MLYRTFHAKINEFIERVPSATVVNRFSTDLSELEGEIGTTIDALVNAICSVLAQIFFTAYSVSWWILLLVIPLFYLEMRFLNYYMTTKREIKRLTQACRSPILNLISDTINGLSSIRSFRIQKTLSKEMDTLIEEELKNDLVLHVMQKWFMIRCTLIASFFIELPSY
jgi:ATP-binding cassette subfamily C (CFTR/MRP) protein 1